MSSDFTSGMVNDMGSSAMPSSSFEDEASILFDVEVHSALTWSEIVSFESASDGGGQVVDVIYKMLLEYVGNME